MEENKLHLRGSILGEVKTEIESKSFRGFSNNFHCWFPGGFYTGAWHDNAEYTYKDPITNEGKIIRSKEVKEMIREIVIEKGYTSEDVSIAREKLKFLSSRGVENNYEVLQREMKVFIDIYVELRMLGWSRELLRQLIV